jgi:RNA polymerase sigma-70 factor (ECF subfamily)
MSSESGPRENDLLAQGRFLRSLARGLVGDAERAEDLVHETYAAALAHPPCESSAPRAWLARVLRSLAAKRGRRESERPLRESVAARERGELELGDPPALLAEIELARRLFETLERQREPYRSTLYLRYYRGLAPREIAVQQGLPLKTVKTRLARGLEALRGELDRREGGREAWVALLLPLARGAPLAPHAAPPEPGGLLAPGLAAAGILLAAGVATWVALRAPEVVPASSSAEAPVEAPAEAPLPASPARVAAREAVSPTARAPRETLRGVTLTGSVLDASRRPLAGVEACALVLEHGPPWRGGPGGRQTVVLEEVRSTSAADGAFTLTLARAGFVRLALELDGHAPRARRLFAVDGQALELEPLVLEAGAALEGTLLDPDGRPVENAELFLESEDEGLIVAGESRRSQLAGRSDAQGRFTLRRIAAGTLWLEVQRAGFVARRLRAIVPWPEAELGPLEIELEPALRLEGEVLALMPGEFERVQLLARALGPGGSGPSRRTERVPLDARGRFVLDGLAPDEERELVLIEADGLLGRLRSEPLRVRAGAGPVQLMAQPLAAPELGPLEPERRGILRAPEAGSATERLSIQVRAVDGSESGGALVAHRGLDEGAGFGLPEVRASDGNGRLDWSGLTPGRHAFRVVSGRFGPEEGARAAWAEVELGRGDPGSLELAALVHADLGGRVRAGGRALAGARLALRPGDGPGAPGTALVVRADADGRFAFAALPLGDYWLEITHPDRTQGEQRSIRLAAGGVALALELPEASLAGRVLAVEGGALSGAHVSVLAARDQPFGPRPDRRGEVRTDADGRFELAGLDPALPVRLELCASGRATLQREVVLEGRALEFMLAPEVPVTVELASAGPRFQLLAEGPQGERLAFPLAGGRTTTLGGLGPGRWRLVLFAAHARRGGGPLETREVELQVGAPLALRFDGSR